MNKKQFLRKWQIGSSSTAYYKKRFPEILNEKNLIDYGKLDKIIQHRQDIKKLTQETTFNKKAKEIEWLFTGANIEEKSHIFLYQLNAELYQILVRDSAYKRYLQILDYFEVEYNKEILDEEIKC